MRTVLPVPPFAGSLVPPAAMHARAPSTASASSAHLAAGSSSSPAEAAAAAGEGSPGSDGARALQARLQLAGTQLIEEERMMRPRPEQVEPLRDFSATMDELSILGRIQPHGFLIAVEEFLQFPVGTDTHPVIPSSLVQAHHQENARATAGDEVDLSLYDSSAPPSSSPSGETTRQGSDDLAALNANMARMEVTNTSAASRPSSDGTQPGQGTLRVPRVLPVRIDSPSPQMSPDASVFGPGGARGPHSGSMFNIRTMSSNLQHLVAESSEALIGSPLGVLLGVEQLRRLRTDLSLSHALQDLNPWPCVLHVREEALTTSAVRDVLRDRMDERRRVDQFAREHVQSHPRVPTSPLPPVSPIEADDPARRQKVLAQLTHSQDGKISSSHRQEELSHILAKENEPQAGEDAEPYVKASSSNTASSSVPQLPSLDWRATVTGPALSAAPSQDRVRVPADAVAPANSGRSQGLAKYAEEETAASFSSASIIHPAIGVPPVLPTSSSTSGVRLPFPPIPAPHVPTYTGPLIPHRFDVIFHRSGGLLVMEFEPAPEQDAQARTIANFRRQALRALNRLQHASSYTDLLARCASEMRLLCGFDRVMVYRFHPDSSGEVVAESKTSTFELDDFLGLMYPANDIPPQARALYVRNKFRTVGDVAFRGVPLIPQMNPLTAAPFDLTNSILRSVHPIHLQYLRNMGVRSSMSVSIVIGGELWGLIACHHYRASRYLDHETRLVAEQVGDLMASQIPHQLQRQHNAQMNLLRSDLEHLSLSLVTHTQHKHQWAEALLHEHATLMRMFGATGISIQSGGRIWTAGETPPQDVLLKITSFVLQSGLPTKLYSTTNLTSVVPSVRPYLSTASGLLSLLLSPKDSEVIQFFRPEIRTTVMFGGKPTDDKGEEHLTPRNSFAIWSQLKSGQSSAWEKTTLQIAEEFMRLMIETKLIYYYQDEQAQEKARLMLSEEIRRKQIDWIDTICHEIRNPINGIMGSLIIARDEIRRMEALLLTTPADTVAMSSTSGPNSSTNAAHVKGMSSSGGPSPSLFTPTVSNFFSHPNTTTAGGNIEAPTTPSFRSRTLRQSGQAVPAGAGSAASESIVTPDTPSFRSRSLRMQLQLPPPVSVAENPPPTLLALRDAQLTEHLTEIVTNLSNIEQCAAHQKVIADDVLGLSKLEQNRVALDHQPFNLPDCVQQAVSMFDASLRLKQMTLELNCDLPPQFTFVKGDAFRLRQILANILSNAIKFSHQNGQVEITLRVSEDQPFGLPDDYISALGSGGATGAMSDYCTSDSSSNRSGSSLSMGSQMKSPGSDTIVTPPSASLTSPNVTPSAMPESSPRPATIQEEVAGTPTAATSATGVIVSLTPIASGARASSDAAASVTAFMKRENSQYSYRRTSHPIEYVVTVKDYGVGISEQTLANLFKPYQQAGARVSATYEGSGLGLCIARELARLMGGDCVLSSTLGVGTTCSITFQSVPLSAERVAEWRAKQSVSEEVDEMMSSMREMMMACQPHMPSSLHTTTTQEHRNSESPAQSDSSPDSPASSLSRRDIHGNPLHTPPPSSTASMAPSSDKDSASVGSSGSAMSSTQSSPMSLMSGSITTPHTPSVTVTSTFPLVRTPSAQTYRPRVLLMEDNVINMKVLRRILEILGCICTSAFNGVEGVQAFEGVFVPPYTKAFDMVATDLEMPLMNGLEAIRVIRGMEHRARQPPGPGRQSSGGMRKLGGRLASQNDSRHTSDESNDGRNAVVMAVSQTPPQQSGSSSNPQTPLPLQLPGAPVLISPSRALLPDPSDLSPPLPPPCYIVCISGNVRSEFVDAAKEAGADEYLGKPFEKQALRNAINQARKKQRAYASDHPPRAVSFDEIHYHPPTSALQVVTPSMVRSSILSAIDSADVPA